MFSNATIFHVWNFEPSVLLGTACLILGYGFTIGPLRRRWNLGASVPATQQAIFYLGSLCMLLALIGPLDVLGDESLLSAHMAQHLILTFVVPPLWVLGTPAWLIKRLLPVRLLKVITNPSFAFAIFNIVMWIWHVPAIYDAALSHEDLHVTEHLLFMSASIIGWLPVLKSELGDGITPLTKLIYLLPSMFSCTALAALITLAPTQLYRFYGNAALQLGISPMSDQQVAGLIMWLPGDMLYLILIVRTFSLFFDQASVQEVKV